VHVHGHYMELLLGRVIDKWQIRKTPGGYVGAEEGVGNLFGAAQSVWTQPGTAAGNHLVVVSRNFQRAFVRSRTGILREKRRILDSPCQER
jgi:hypothetical protein